MRWIAAIAVMLLLGACAGQKPLPGGGPAVPAAALRLGVGDRLEITTFGEPSLSGKFQITPTGTIAFPLIGAIPAAGLETGELSRAIEQKLSDGYVNDPRVAVEVAAYRPIYILGEVRKPGEYPYVIGLTVRGAVAKAEGFTYRANEKRVFLKRAGEPGESVYPLTADFAVLPGDTIRFGERYF